MHQRLRALLLVVIALAASCGDDDDSGANGVRPVTVFAAASLTEAFTEAEDRLGLEVTYSFAGSQALVTQIQQGASADVVASADEANMQKLIDAGLVDEPRVFARNQLVIAVEPGNPKGIRSLADLADADVAVVLADPAVPVGKYARQALDHAGVAVTPTSLELDAKAALAKVTLGEADASIVYFTDVAAARGKADGVNIVDSDNVIATYPIAVVKDTPRRAAAEAFVAAALSGPVQDALRARGFLPPG